MAQSSQIKAMPPLPASAELTPTSPSLLSTFPLASSAGSRTPAFICLSPSSPPLERGEKLTSWGRPNHKDQTTGKSHLREGQGHTQRVPLKQSPLRADKRPCDAASGSSNSVARQGQHMPILENLHSFAQKNYVFFMFLGDSIHFVRFWGIFVVLFWLIVVHLLFVFKTVSGFHYVALAFLELCR